MIDAAQAVFEEIASTYAESSWTTIRGNGTEAENRLDWSTEAFEAATEANWIPWQRLAQVSRFWFAKYPMQVPAKASPAPVGSTTCWTG